MDIGLTFTFYDRPLGSSPLIRFLIVQAFYIPIMLTSLIIGIRIWKKKQKPLREEALKLLKELE